jgi:quinone-modifying oxidoreductase, subunit QmoC
MELKRTVKFEADRDPEFARWVSHTVGGERIRHCLQCGLCSGKCPLSLYMDYTPRRLMHLSREGFKEEVLGSTSIWLCTACYACMVECPKQINVTHLLYALKQRAIEEGRYPRRFAIPIMSKEFVRMVRGAGRITESLLVVRILMRSAIWRLLGMSRLGLKLFRAGRMAVKPERIERRKEIAVLLDAVAATRKELSI